MNAKEMREQSPEELQKTLIGLLEDQFKMRMSKSAGQLTRTHKLKEVRRDIARAKTLLNEKQGS